MAFWIIHHRKATKEQVDDKLMVIKLFSCNYARYLYKRLLSNKPLLFKSFTGLTVKEFDEIYKEITERYHKHEIQRLSKRKYRKRDIGAVGRHFTLDTRDRFLMILVYYRLYITYTLAGFLFGLDQSNVCRDIQKIGVDKTMCTNSTEDIQNNKEAKNARGSRKILSWIYGFYRLYRTTTDTKTYR